MDGRVSTFALAGAFKEGDLAVGGTTDERVREEARRALAAMTIGEVARTRFVDDAVSAALEAERDHGLAAEIAPTTIGELARVLLAPEGAAFARRYEAALPSEAIAAVAKILSDEELSILARRLATPLEAGLSSGSVGIGAAQHLGSRIQPNSAGDDEEEILFSILEGLAFGCGDVILGLNPASDDVETIVRLERLLEDVVRALELPTRTCVLSDIVKQTTARERTHVDVGFQSLAGTSRALAGMVGLDVDGITELARGFDGLYFETGQGSEVTNGAAAGVDMATLEARTYGVARLVRRRAGKRWTIVNDVAGFIGPEVFTSGAQLRRVCLEDVVMARLHGLTMGLDVCSTFHMGIAPAELRRLTAEIAERAAPAYLMAVAGNADPMLGYLTTSFREHAKLRRATGRRAASAMASRLAALGVGEDGDVGTVSSLYARVRRAAGERRSEETLAAEGRRRLAALRDRGLEVGGGADEAGAHARVERIHAAARRALYAEIDPRVLRDACPRHESVRTRATSRDEFLARPTSGERIREDDVARLRRLAAGRGDVQIVVSDGLDADAVNESLRELLPPLRAGLVAIDAPSRGVDVVVTNGRVRAGYHVAGVLDVELLVHLIGERPGTGLDTLSAYLTYGRDAGGASRWSPELDHSATTAICGIHRRAKPPQEAAREIVRVIARMRERRASGVALGA